jgi:hypothetical protein
MNNTTLNLMVLEGLGRLFEQEDPKKKSTLAGKVIGG